MARHMAEKRGFLHVSMSDSLIRAYMRERGIADSLFATVLEHKADIRTELQQFGITSGFDNQPHWMEYCLSNWHPEQDVVIEKVRTNQQARWLKDKGFFIVELAVTWAVRLERARNMGVDEERLLIMMQHPVEQGIHEDYIDTVINATGSVELYANYVVNRGRL